MSKINIGPFRKKAIPPALTVTFTDSAGAAVNITSMTIKFVYRAINGTTETNRDGVVVTGSSGIAKYVWVEADFDTPGSFEGVMWAYDADEQYWSETFVWIVEAGLYPTTL